MNYLLSTVIGTVNDAHWNDNNPANANAEAIANVIGPLYFIVAVISIVVIVFTIFALIGNIISLMHGINNKNETLILIASIGIVGCLFLPIAGIICMYVSINVDTEERNLLVYTLCPLLISVVVSLLACLFMGPFVGVIKETLTDAFAKIQSNALHEARVSSFH